MGIELSELLLPDATAWNGWLAENYASSPGVRLVLHKKGGTITALTYAAALDEALCYGWIDGVIGKRDGGSYLTRFTPRTARSRWSKNNVDNIARLEEEGRLQSAGKAAVAAAQADGRWEVAYSGQGAAEVPADLATAIAADPAAQAMFNVLTSVNRYALIYRVNAVKTAGVRAAKITDFVAMLSRGETPHPQKRRP
ncbi:YdeI/OmpD-associated family protein [Paenarthrobacter sp. Z7-10]|uniref:YdeI/OmpD-associated family protein n=1 Tax=Paenarthrobacter sp. Z7-10 TaxID=2787635 RepID=UPI0022A9F53D|nr:YdeI/OmpD-associated family protein [Paenarthrobacter sp. Z7-10]MCZ2402837.1 YdeI/OmpD-associated family protein [Paenarthrobacter sp. Z7-10]